MPETVDPHGARPYAPPLDSTRDDGSDVRVNSLRLRFGTVVHRTRLTRALAKGVDPSAGDELALRARQLTSERNRKMLARSLRRTIADGHLPARTRARVSIIDRRGVLNAEAAIVEMIERLLSPLPVRAEGMAMIELILTNADGSPLYNRSEPGALRRMVRDAIAALDGFPSRSHEFPLAIYDKTRSTTANRAGGRASAPRPPARPAATGSPSGEGLVWSAQRLRNARSCGRAAHALLTKSVRRHRGSRQYSASPLADTQKGSIRLARSQPKMRRQPLPNHHDSRAPTGWSLLLASWAAAPDSRPRRSWTVRTAPSRILRVLRDHGRRV